MAKKQQGQGSSLDLGVLDDGTVVMQFGQLVKQMTFSPEQAKSLGLGLIEMGTRGESLHRVQMDNTRGHGARKN